MTAATKPATRPANPHFSSGPCAKRPGWSLAKLDKAFLGRSHRAKEGKARLKLAIDRTRALLGLPPRLCVRHRAGFRHRRLRDGDVDHAGAPAVSMRWPGRASARAGSPTSASSSRSRTCGCSTPSTAGCPISPRSTSTATCSSPGTAPPPACACPTATGSPADRRGLTFADATSAVLRAADRLGEGRCRHLLLAEGAGRGSRARHADPIAARHRAAREPTRRPGRCRRSSA